MKAGKEERGYLSQRRAGYLMLLFELSRYPWSWVVWTPLPIVRFYHLALTFLFVSRWGSSAFSMNNYSVFMSAICSFSNVLLNETQDPATFRTRVLAMAKEHPIHTICGTLLCSTCSLNFPVKDTGVIFFWGNPSSFQQLPCYNFDALYIITRFC